MVGGYCSDVKLLVCVFTVLFGMGSWIAINGIWVELPILVDELPEGWNLPSYMSVIIQLANIGPISVTLCNLFKKRPSEKGIIYVVVGTGSAAALLMAFFWTRTTFVAGEERSTALLTLLFFTSLGDCTSSVLFLPFMNTFKHQYLTSYYIGEGFSGLLPSVVALAQGVGQVDCVNTSVVNITTNVTEYQIQGVYRSPAFPVKDFFLFVFAMCVVCGISFTLLNYLPYCKTEHTKRYQAKQASNNTSQSTDELNNDIGMSSTQHFVDVSEDLPDAKGRSYQLQLKPVQTEHEMSTSGYVYFLLLIGWVNAITNGVLPSIQTYACLPYGSDAYHLAVTLSNIANPVACFVAFFVPVRSATVIGLVTCVGSAVAMYILTLAILSPVPPLVDTVTGAALVVTAFVIVYLLLSFTKVAIAGLFRVEGRRALLWCGAVTQLGSAIGAAVMFVTVNVYNLFIQKYPCT